MDNLETSSGVSTEAAMPHKPRTRIRVKPRHRLHVGMWLARFLLLLGFLVGFYFAVLPVGRATARSLLVLPGLLSVDQPVWQEPVDEPVAHTQLTLDSSVETVNLDVYAPTDSVPPVPGSREAVLVIPGVGDNRQDPQLVNFSQTLARAGVVVMDMLTPALLDFRLDPNDTEAVVQSFQKLQTWPGVSAQKVGMLGFSGGGPLMCLAAADPRIQKQVAFVTLFGSYFDAITLLQTIGRRELTVDGQTQPWQPVDVPLQVLANTLAPYLPTSDGLALTTVFGPNGGGTLTSIQLGQLSPAGAAAYHLLAGDQPEQVDANLAALPAVAKMVLHSLSPSSVLDQIRAPIYLLHDRNDQYVPVSESYAFAAALAKLHHPYDFAALGIFQHVEVRSDLGWTQVLGDARNLLRVINEIVRVGS
jgi:dienelactone hydrolase